MKYLKIFLASVSLIFLASCAVHDRPIKSDIAAVPEQLMAQIPAANKKFEWRFYKNALFQKPIGWNEKERQSVSNGIQVFGYGSSKENFSESQFFEMGMSVQVISGSNKIKGITATQLAAIYIKQIIDSHKKDEILMLDHDTKEDHQVYFFRYKDSANGQKTIIIHKFIMASDTTDTVHIFVFESPENSWESNWAKYGTPFLKNIFLVKVQ